MVGVPSVGRLQMGPGIVKVYVKWQCRVGLSNTPWLHSHVYLPRPWQATASPLFFTNIGTSIKHNDGDENSLNSNKLELLTMHILPHNISRNLLAQLLLLLIWHPTHCVLIYQLHYFCMTYILHVTQWNFHHFTYIANILNIIRSSQATFINLV